MAKDNRPLPEREPKRPTWNAALIAGRATLGGETSGKLFFLSTAGFVVAVVAAYIVIKALV
jgi:hypothetical protein